ncbi:MAG: Serine/threonine-protein kinase [Phylliscum demangeonii]|nr:MAG: Serine/threonine-protein kinase [Phylliscum demangeonii]
MDTFSEFFTTADALVLHNLLADIGRSSSSSSRSGLDPDADQRTIDQLARLTTAGSADFEPTVLTGWDVASSQQVPGWLYQAVIQPYIGWAQGIVRHPTDVVFLTHLLLYLATSVPSALYLICHRFSWLHGLAHWAMTAYYCGPFTILLHNHIHNGGVLQRRYAAVDWLWPYVLEPLMGHSWDSYYYHHVKHHHVENNGPHDLSSTLRYQRDSLRHFLCYLARFLLLVWIELPLYFVRRRQRGLAVRAFASELASGLVMGALLWCRFRAAVFVLLLPLVQMRVAMMVGNWGQHALVDELEPDSDFRSSITLIDVASNRFCFNDGWHTSHHLNPRRHWREHPRSFLQAKEQYRAGRALVFRNIDYLGMTVRLLRKDYAHLATCLVPIGDQVGWSQDEVVRMLRTKTRRFDELEIARKFAGGRSRGGAVGTAKAEAKAKEAE